MSEWLFGRSWIPDETVLKYRLKGTNDEWQVGKVIDDRKYDEDGEIMHTIMFMGNDNETTTITCSINLSTNGNGSKGTHDIAKC